MRKILGKYELIKKIENKYKAKYADREFDILQIERNDNNEMFSYISSKLNSLSHENLKTIRVEEDDSHFYLITECFSDLEKIDSSMFEDDSEYGSGVNYKNLFECYLQLCEAMIYIDKEGYCHGNINPSNILIDTNEKKYKAFLSNFGKRYYYRDFKRQGEQKEEQRFFAPERNMAGFVPDIRSDIYDFGLCMLTLLLDGFEDFYELDFYKEPQDLDYMFAKLRSGWDCTDIDEDIFLLVKKCCTKEPESRISLDELKEEILKIYDKTLEKHTYELRCESIKTLEIYAENNSLDFKCVMEHINERIKEQEAFIRQIERENKNSNKMESNLEIVIGDLVFVCSAKSRSSRDSYLWVWEVRENDSKRMEEIRNDGLELRHNFIFTTKGCSARDSEASNIAMLKEELDYRFKTKKLEEGQKKTDIRSIASEEELLEAEKKDIESKKKMRFAKIKAIKSGEDSIILKLLDDTTEKDEGDVLENRKENEREFKPQEKVIIQERSKTGSLNKDDCFKGDVKTYKSNSKEIVIKLKEKYDALFSKDNERELKKKDWAISYDYQIREIILSKKQAALDKLKKGDTKIPNLLRKINEPTELERNSQIELDTYFNESLDDNQKEAVGKALSLESGCEILLIQGPPGTGKTTTITEIVKQYQKKHRHYKILITSQSNQAVDNVLEKICVSESNKNGEDKIFRVGNVKGDDGKRKISEIASQYTPEAVLNKILKENKERIKKNNITDSNPNIESKLQEMQQGFLKSLETLSSELSTKNKRDSETFKLFTKDIRLFFGTLIGISSWKDFREVEFDVVIVDEAGRATLSELLVPCIKAKRMILVGDHKQLAPVVDDDVIEKLSEKRGKGSASFQADKKDVTTSMFERLFERMESSQEEHEYIHNFKHTLTYNYRAAKSICNLYSNAFYQGALKTKPEINEQKEHGIKSFRASAVWLDTGKRSDKKDEQSGSGKINRCNANIIYHTLKVLKEQILASGKISDIGIITPYKAQAELLDRELKSLIKEYKDLKISIDIGTVDSFQGSDRDIIIYDCVRSGDKNTKKAQKNKQGSKIDFIADEKRLNVSLSRSKKLLCIVGDKEYLNTASVSTGNNPFSAIIKEFDDNKDEYEVKIL